MAKSLVSVIIPTRNSAATLPACLRSLSSQTYQPIETIVVDRDSTDTTVQIAKTAGAHVYQHGPERSAQRNFGAERATGHYLLFIDSDMELDPPVIAACLQAHHDQPQLAATIIPETSFGRGFWAHCKALERSYYTGVNWMESPRFIPAATFRQAGGFNTAIAGGEDWELTQRLRALGPIARITSLIRHNEGHLTLRGLIKKRLYYAHGFARVYTTRQSSPAHDALRLYGLFFSRPRTALRHPIRWLGLIIMKTTELTASAVGYIGAKHKNQESNG